MSTAEESTSRSSMTPRMRRRAPRLKKATAASAAVRLHEVYGESPATWENRMYGASSDYQQVARINGVLRDLGQSEKVAELMVPVDASMAPRHSRALEESLNRAEMADAAEQVADENFRGKLRTGTATGEDAREYLRKSAAQRATAEEAEHDVLEWIRKQEGR